MSISISLPPRSTQAGRNTPCWSAIVDAAAGTVSYTPNTGFAGNDSFSYTIQDANGATSTATVASTCS